MFTPIATSAPHPALHAAQPTQIIPLPESTEHVDVMLDVKALWEYTQRLKDPEVEGKVRAEFLAHPNARTDASEALTLRLKLRTLLRQPLPAPDPAASFADLFAPPTEVEDLFAAPAPQPAPVVTPAPATPEPEAAPVVTAPDPEATPEPTSEGDAQEDEPVEDAGAVMDDGSSDGEDSETEDEGDGDDATDAPASEPVSAAPAPLLEPLPRTVTWGDGLLGTGLISGLARTLARGDLVQLVVTRVSDEDLLVTVLPRRLDGEPATLDTDMNVRGTPLELDSGLLEAVPTYEQVRLSARDVAAELLERTRAKAAEAKKAPAKAAPPAKTTGKPAPKPAAKPTQGAVTFTLGNTDLTPADVRVHVSGKGDPVTGKLVDLASIKLDPGTYAAEFAASGFESAKASVTVTAGKTETVKVTLKAMAAAPLF